MQLFIEIYSNPVATLLTGPVGLEAPYGLSSGTKTAHCYGWNGQADGRLFNYYGAECCPRIVQNYAGQSDSLLNVLMWRRRYAQNLKTYICQKRDCIAMLTQGNRDFSTIIFM